MKRILITGITGQDGSYLPELLLERGYEVHGMVRRASQINTQRVDHLYANPNLHLHYGDLTDSSNINKLLMQIEPDEIYNLGAMSHVKVSFEVPEYVAQVDGVGTLRLLDAIQNTGRKIKFYQASTSELYGKVQEIPQSETTPFYPRSPYAVAKLYGFWIVKNFREAYGMFASNGILFNHESPRRGPTFVTRKITMAAAAIARGKQEHVTLGNLDAQRDWGYAREYCEAMIKIMEHDTPGDWVVATGRTTTVRDFCTMAFKYAGMNIAWEIRDEHEIAVDTATGKVVVKTDQRYLRPTEVELLIGDPSKAKRELDWSPATDVEGLCQMMVEHDLKELEG